MIREVLRDSRDDAMDLVNAFRQVMPVLAAGCTTT